ncbi:glycoside hydrolase family 32 protein [uncultured Faecalibaculum sp.]|uniref:glycoside hydrolase family 32 protein n=1 Tax=uncultured Faecalibaculum sp. TaxID=1729681 RepID=UPI00272E3067|nr:glycoside hydrolase family 32 protein [uncultured Faecalibaculum sp.]
MKNENNKKVNLIKSAAVSASAMMVLSGASAAILASESEELVADQPVVDVQAPEEVILETAAEENDPVEAAAEIEVPQETEIYSSTNAPAAEAEEESASVGEESEEPGQAAEAETPEAAAPADPAVPAEPAAPAVSEEAVPEPEAPAVSVKADTSAAAPADNAKAETPAADKEQEDEAYREQYHFSNEQGWSNDPNGMVYFNGTWHLFFQYYPDGVNHGSMSWGHATSTDLVHWTEHEVPDVFKASTDNGMRFHFSGSAVVDKNNTSGFFKEGEQGLVAVWTLAGMPSGASWGSGEFGFQRQCIAYSADGFNWTAPDLGIERVILNADGTTKELTADQKDFFKNVVLAEGSLRTVVRDAEGNITELVNEDPLNNGDFRDPKVFWHEESGQWMMAVAGGPLRFYSSKDLIHWTPEAMQGDIITECPELYYLPVEGTDEYKYVLSEGGRWYQVGDFKEVDGVWTFVPDTVNGPTGDVAARYNMNYAPDAYAAQSFYKEDGRVVMVQWMSNWSYADNSTVRQPDGSQVTLEGIRKMLGEKHNGQFTLMADLSVVRTPEGLRLKQTPVAEYDQMKNLEVKDDIVLDDKSNPLEGIHSQQFQFEIEFAPEKGTEKVVLEVLKNKDYQTTIWYDVNTGILHVDRSKSMAAEQAPADHMQNGTWFKFLEDYTAPVAMTNGKIKLKVFVDNYSVEVYAGNDTIVLTELVFPYKDADLLNLYAVGTPVNATYSFATMDSYRKDNTDMRNLSGTLADAKDQLERGQGNYTDESFKALQDAYKAAFAAAFNPDSTQNSINLANYALTNALTNLRANADKPITVTPEKPTTVTDIYDSTAKPVVSETPAQAVSAASVSSEGTPTAAATGLGMTLATAIGALAGAVFTNRKRREQE